MTLPQAAADFARAFGNAPWLLEVGYIENCRCRGGAPESYIVALSARPLAPGLLGELATWRGYHVRFFVGDEWPGCKEGA